MQKYTIYGQKVLYVLKLRSTTKNDPKTVLWIPIGPKGQQSNRQTLVGSPLHGGTT